jgi:hypothetical protein
MDSGIRQCCQELGEEVLCCATDSLARHIVMTRPRNHPTPMSHSGSNITVLQSTSSDLADSTPDNGRDAE